MSSGSLPARLVLLLATLLLAWGLFVGLLAWRVAAENEHEALQRLSYGLADHIVKHWPELGGGTNQTRAPLMELPPEPSLQAELDGLVRY